MRHKILWDLKIQTDNLISVRRRDLELIKREREKERERENLQSRGFHRFTGAQS